MNSSHDSSSDWMVLLGMIIILFAVFIVTYKIIIWFWKSIKIRKASQKRGAVKDMTNILPLKKIVRH